MYYCMRFDGGRDFMALYSKNLARTFSCEIANVCLLLYRGDEFRKEYSRLSEVRSILPVGVNVMALTATATRTLRKDVCDLLSMENPVLVSVSPDKKTLSIWLLIISL